MNYVTLSFQLTIYKVKSINKQEAAGVVRGPHHQLIMGSQSRARGGKGRGRVSEISILRGGSPAHVSIVRELLITRDSYGKSAANDCYRTDLAGHCELGS